MAARRPQMTSKKIYFQARTLLTYGLIKSDTAHGALSYDWEYLRNEATPVYDMLASYVALACVMEKEFIGKINEQHKMIANLLNIVVERDKAGYETQILPDVVERAAIIESNLEEIRAQMRKEKVVEQSEKKTRASAKARAKSFAASSPLDAILEAAEPTDSVAIGATRENPISEEIIEAADALVGVLARSNPEAILARFFPKRVVSRDERARALAEAIALSKPEAATKAARPAVESWGGGHKKSTASSCCCGLFASCCEEKANTAAVPNYGTATQPPGAASK